MTQAPEAPARSRAQISERTFRKDKWWQTPRIVAAGYPHRVLPLSGITHMASQEAVAENLLLLQLDFLRGALGLAAS